MRIALLISLLLVLHTAVAKPPATPVVSLSPAEAAALGTYTPQPEYPLVARRQRITGSGVYRMEVEIASGIVHRVDVERSTGSSVLDDAVVRTFTRWRFKPQLLRSAQRKYAPHETAKEVGIRVPITFAL